MKVFYIGCKPVMNALRMSFPRGDGVDVSEGIGEELLKIDGFVTSMDAAAKKVLKFNDEREKAEKEKLAGNVQVVKVPDNSLEDEIKQLKKQLKEAVGGSQLESLMKENESLKQQLEDVQAKLSQVNPTTTKPAKTVKSGADKSTATKVS